MSKRNADSRMVENLYRARLNKRREQIDPKSEAEKVDVSALNCMLPHELTQQSCSSSGSISRTCYDCL